MERVGERDRKGEVENLERERGRDGEGKEGIASEREG